ncbi:MAG TPA: carbon-nitrogen hydrolase family protein [Bacteroidales bacterium]|nr:carbon-nitrogen hydrolase family protein [Bacteroidales bacterium]
MKKLFCLILLACIPSGFVLLAQNIIPNPGFENSSGNLPESWSANYPRKEIAPVFSTDNSVAHSGKSSARISSGGNVGTYGFLTVSAKGIISRSSEMPDPVTLPDSAILGNTSYLIGGHFRTSEGLDPQRNVRMRVAWLDKDNNEILAEFITNKKLEKDWYRVAEIKTAPLNAAGISISLVLQWTDKGSAWWDDIFAEKAPSQEKRIVRIASASDWPRHPSTTEKNLEFYSQKIIEAGSLGADIICLGEGITTVSTGKNFEEAAETIPGPASKALGEAARKAGAYVIAGIYEREGKLIYNTALLIDRQGNVAGKYRKIHLPETEVTGGLTPGSEYPVFKTDFGTIGIEICYDNFFPEVAHNLMLNGAEIIFCPIWGDIRGLRQEWDIVSRARAIDNAVFFVASMYEKGMSRIVDPNGKVLPDSGNKAGLIISPVNLGMRTFERWLSMKSFGEWRNLMPMN